ncbi:MAG: ATP-binding protein [Proteobacteria bacterium]|nr:ATP-binding protein [Pseudomonadota bacterium]
MTIKRTLIWHSITIIGLLAATGLFALHDVDNLVTMTRFMEIQEKLNASFLEMRLLEKNYFLFKDDQAIHDIANSIRMVDGTLDDLSRDMIKAAGQEKYQDLRHALDAYRNKAQDIAASKARDEDSEMALRESGRQVLEFSTGLTMNARGKIGELISGSKRNLLISFPLFLVLAVFSTPIIFSRILSSLDKISLLALEVSQGRFLKIEGPVQNNELGAVITAMNTMSEQLRLREDELVQSKKLNSLGFLTAGVAHELNNPLNNISMICQTYEAMYDSIDAKDRLEFVSQIAGEVERIQAIVMSLLDFAKPKPTIFMPGGVNAVVRRSLKLVRNTLDVTNIEVLLDLTAGLPLVNMDVNQISQVLVNLFNNAIQAMSEDQTLAVRTRLSPDGMVEIEVQDTGHGMTPETLSSIFDPFFSTKGTDGTGLGLSVSYGIIKNHQGQINVQSEIDRGTTFDILLPAVESGEVENE